MPVTGNEIELTFELRNPLMIPLTYSEFRVEGNLLNTQIVHKIKKVSSIQYRLSTQYHSVYPYMYAIALSKM